MSCPRLRESLCVQCGNPFVREPDYNGHVCQPCGDAMNPLHEASYIEVGAGAVASTIELLDRCGVIVTLDVDRHGRPLGVEIVGQTDFSSTPNRPPTHPPTPGPAYVAQQSVGPGASST